MRILLTGATGYVGKHLAARLLRGGHQVVALVRGSEPADRVRAALAPLADAGALGGDCSWAGGLTVVGGDVSAPGCGLDVAARRRLHRCDALLHCAGLTRFEAHMAPALQQQNVTGTQAVFELAAALGIPHFHHVSTAYVAGRTRAPFGAQMLDCRQGFNNPYEASKFDAERWLHGASRPGAPRITMHRPSVVVGGCPLGAGNAVSTVYTFMKAVRFVRECCVRDRARGWRRFARIGAECRDDRFHLPLRIAADPAATINLVAIEDVVDSILDSLTPAGDAPVHIVQLTGQEFRIDTLAAAMQHALRVDGIELVPATAFETRPANALEAHFARLTQVYAPYLFGSPHFVDSALTAPRRIDPVRLTTDFERQLALREGPRRPREVGRLALDTLAVDTPEDYFAALLAGAVGRTFLSRHDYVDAEIAFHLTGRKPGEIRLHFAGGAVRRVPASGVAPACRYELDSDLFMRVIAGERDLRAAFLAGQVRIAGDKELALKFGALLGMYYQHIDTHVVEELTA